MHLILTGYRASGKSSLAKRCAGILQLPLYDTDQLVEENAGCSIKDIFSRQGEVYFRKLESTALQEVLAKPAAVIATGGGIVESEENRRVLAMQPAVCWLRADLTELARRLAGDQNRPSLTGGGVDKEVQAVYVRREPWYQQISDWSVDTTARPFDKIAVEISNRYRQLVQEQLNGEKSPL